MAMDASFGSATLNDSITDIPTLASVVKDDSAVVVSEVIARFDDFCDDEDKRTAFLEAAKDGWTPLTMCSMNGWDSSASTLLSAGANTEAQDGLGMRPLHWAVQR